MKALSIRQPWAWAIIHAGKDVENRKWATTYRGPILIHAASKMPHVEFLEADKFIRGVLGGSVPYARGEAEKRGGIIGVADLTDCVRESSSPWFMGRPLYGFVLSNVRSLPLHPCPGKLGIFEVPYELAELEARA